MNTAGSMNWYNLMNTKRCVEPIKRCKGSTYPQWQSHRFEIKGGITWRDAFRQDMFGQKMIVDGKFRNITIRIVSDAS